MTDWELIGILQSCPDAEYGCSRCPYHTSLHCRESLMHEAAEVLERHTDEYRDKYKKMADLYDYRKDREQGFI